MWNSGVPVMVGQRMVDGGIPVIGAAGVGGHRYTGDGRTRVGGQRYTRDRWWAADTGDVRRGVGSCMPVTRLGAGVRGFGVAAIRPGNGELVG